MLCNVSSFSRKELSIDGKKQELKKEENNNTRIKKCELKRKRRALV